MSIKISGGTLSGNGTILNGSGIESIEMSGVTIQTTEKTLADIMSYCGFAESDSETRRLVNQGAVKYEGKTIYNSDMEFCSGDSFRLQVGKTKDATIIVQ